MRVLAKRTRVLLVNGLESYLCMEGGAYSKEMRPPPYHRYIKEAKTAKEGQLDHFHKRRKP